MSKLIINLDEDYKIKVENKSEFPDSIFKDIYRFSLDKVIEIVKNTYPRFETADFKSNESPNVGDDANNIIAFVGERGKGKSSSMISFRNAILKTEDNESDKLGFNKLRQVKFASIDVIDPSFFKGNENLFEIILAKMFSKFQSDLIKSSSRFSDESKRRLMKSFHNVYENLQLLNSGRTELFKLEAIEALSKLGTSSNLKKDFTNLLNNYLEVYGSHFLVITIDDFDLNYSNVFEMLEDIRQFLIQNNILILVACKIEQLIGALEDKFLATKKSGQINSLDDVKNRAVKYLDKLIPFGRRIYLPSFDQIASEEFVILKDGLVLNNWGKNVNNKLDIETLVSRLLFNNFDILLTKNEYRLNSIIPKTIREAQSLLRVLVSTGEDKYYILKNYILQEVSNKDIYIDYFEEIESCYDSQLNLRIIRKIRAVLKSKGYDYQDEATIMKRTATISYLDDLADSKVPRYVSVGDVISAFIILENQTKIDDPELVQFIDFLKLYYVARINLKSLDERKIFSKYGFFSGYPVILRKSNEYRRDFFEIEIRPEQFKGNNQERYILGTMLYSLGRENSAFRYEPAYDRYIPRFGYGVFSPFSIFSNYYNTEELNEAIPNSQVDRDQFVSDCIENIETSKLYKQLYNPYFLIALLSEMETQSIKLLKGSTPKYIFTELLGLFVASFYNSLKSIENKYDYIFFTNNRSEVLFSVEFLKIPIIKTICDTIVEFNKNNLDRNRIIFEIQDMSLSNNQNTFSDYTYDLFTEILHSGIQNQNKNKAESDEKGLLKNYLMVQQAKPKVGKLDLKRLIRALSNLSKPNKNLINTLQNKYNELNAKSYSTMEDLKNSIILEINVVLNGQSS